MMLLLLGCLYISCFVIDRSSYLRELLCEAMQLLLGQMVLLQRQRLVLLVELVRVVQQMPAVLVIKLQVLVELLLLLDIWTHRPPLMPSMRRQLQRYDAAPVQSVEGLLLRLCNISVHHIYLFTQHVELF